ncbi:MAG: maleylacetoacetate isomerase [Woeseiaceae bacterium]
MKLYSYWRSTAAYRVRLALNLKEIEYETVSVSLLPGQAEHRQEEYRERNPQMLVPFLQDGEFGVGQSQAILEYLEETSPATPLLPESARERAAVRSFCNSICCDIHPLNNLRVLMYLKEELGVSNEQRDAWYANWIHEGFRAAEIVASEHTENGRFVFGSSVTLADCCLIPQIYNARRFDVALDDFPRLVEIDAHCATLPEFANAIPELQPDAPARTEIN